MPVSGGTLLMTTDGGRAWGTVACAPAQAQAVCFANASDGFLGTPGKIWRSADGGASWTLSFAEPPKSRSLPEQPGDTPALGCAGPDAAWADFLGFGAAMSNAPYIAYATQDAAVFVSAARGWVVGTDQTVPGKAGPAVIEATTDGGRTWTRQYATG